MLGLSSAPGLAGLAGLGWAGLGWAGLLGCWAGLGWAGFPRGNLITPLFGVSRWDHWCCSSDVYLTFAVRTNSTNGGRAPHLFGLVCFQISSRFEETIKLKTYLDSCSPGAALALASWPAPAEWARRRRRR